VVEFVFSIGNDYTVQNLRSIENTKLLT
jgi:hypothetical protein